MNNLFKNNPTKSPHGKNKKDQHKENPIKRFPIKENTLVICLYANSLVILLAGTMTGILSNHNNPQYFIWSLFILFLLIELEFCLFWYSKTEHTLRKKKIIFIVFISLFAITISGRIFLPSIFIKEPLPPTFTDAIIKNTTAAISVGTSGVTMGYSIGRLKKEPIYPFVLNEYQPFKMYINDDKFSVDVEVFFQVMSPPIKIIHNVLYDLPQNWDRNSNDIALEIVNENYQPIYQLVYKHPFEINLKGLFFYKAGVIVADDLPGMRQMTFGYIQTWGLDFNLKRIFKYPSWRHKGEYENGT